MKKLPVIQENNEEEFSFKSLTDFNAPIYFDNNSTTQIEEEALSAMIKSMEYNYANPSGIHSAGIIARADVENARKNVANLIGCLSEEVIFTSGGTESIITAINSVVLTQTSKKHFITCLTEHSATLNMMKKIENVAGYKVSYLDVDKDGRFSLNQLETFLKIDENNNAMVSLMIANNETGTIHHNLEQAIKLSHKYGALFHIDAVQAAGKMSLPLLIKMAPDFLSISGHKIMASKGIGVLYVKSNTPFSSFILGKQELNKRGGTENVPGIVALGVVSRNPVANFDFRNKFIQLLSNNIPEVIINGGDIWNTVNVGFPYVHRESLVIELSNNGLFASVGSSCSSGIAPSHVLKAMNVDNKYIHGSVRFSFSKNTTENELIKSIDIIKKSYDRIRSISKGVINE